MAKEVIIISGTYYVDHNCAKCGRKGGNKETGYFRNINDSSNWKNDWENRMVLSKIDTNEIMTAKKLGVNNKAKGATYTFFFQQ